MSGYFVVLAAACLLFAGATSWAEEPRVAAFMGDVDLDGTVGPADVKALAALAARQPTGGLATADPRRLSADVDFNGQVDGEDVALLRRWLEERERAPDGPWLRLLGMLLGSGPRAEELEALVEACGSLDEADRVAVADWLAAWLERRGGTLPAGQYGGDHASGLPPQTAAFLVLTGLIELELHVLTSRGGGGGTPGSARVRGLVRRVLDAADQPGRSLEPAVQTAVYERLGAVTRGLDRQEQAAPPALPVPSFSSPPSPSSSSPAPLLPPPPPSDWSALSPPLRSVLLPALLVVAALALLAFLALLVRWRRAVRRAAKARPPGSRLEPLMAGEIYLRSEQYERAIEEFTHLVEQLGGDVAKPARLRLCLALACLGRTDDVRAQLSRADLGDADADLAYRLGVELQRLGLRDEAARALETVRRRRPGFQDVDERLRDLRGLGRVDPADQRAVERLLGGRYVDFRLVAKRTATAVYRVRDARLQRDVALKVVSLSSGTGPAAFLRDAELLAALDHPAVPKVFDFGAAESAFCAMEFVEGDPLDLLVAARSLASQFGRIARVGGDVAEGLAHAASRGLVHGDLTLRDVVVGAGSRARVLGFGLGRDTGQSPVLRGTAASMAPEVLRGAPPGSRADQYSFGVALYEAVAGAFVADGPATAELPFGAPRPLGAVVPGCPTALAEVVRRCLEADPTRRWESFDEVARLLRTVAGA